MASGSLCRDGEVRRGLLGVAIADATPDIVAALEVDVYHGAVVTSVMPGSAAEKAGVQLSDVIVEIDGKQVRGSRQLRNMVGLMRQGQLVELGLYRNGIRESVWARVGGPSGQAIVGDSTVNMINEFRGARLEFVKDDNKYSNHGVEVVSLSQFEDACADGLREGDIIVEAKRRSIEGLGAFNRATSANVAS